MVGEPVTGRDLFYDCCAVFLLSHSCLLRSYPRGDSKRVFVMVKCASFLESYMDDAGSHNGAPVCVIAGYFGGHRRWEPFHNAWKQVLAKYGTKEFHAYKFWRRDDKRQRVGEYKSWSDQKADAYIDELLTIIEENTRIFPLRLAFKIPNGINNPFITGDYSLVPQENIQVVNRRKACSWLFSAALSG